ncbi:long-chain acyl-CoA synthetase [Lipingzhangella halophila]|uniref:Long-chain acyl-CoA synthetase n=1 Tax=Lipingzhangella halophila TaxID=1783352 RepID=A0A7W7RHD2_9ACTN|nr:AMP-binding protein [Lipingzhangella halophila]MBB4932027.1 long-chain acyl-CoA synthetase [Lipingzhangella halophila]
MTDAESPRPLRSLTAVTNRLLTRGSPFEMDVVEIRGTPTRVWSHAPASLRACLETSLEHGDAPALVYGEESISHADYYRTAATLAHRLVDEYGIREGDRVAVAMRNYPEWVIAFFATASIGAIAVPLNSWWTGSELRFGLTDSGSKLLVADGERLDRLADVLPELSIPSIAVRTESALPENSRSWHEVIGQVSPGVRLPEAAPDPDGPATIFYTSGTTGLPKGAVGSHRNMIQNIVTGEYSRARTFMRLGLELSEYQAYVDALPTPSILCVLPLFHATGAQSIMLPILYRGGALVLMYKWDTEEALRLIERERITSITAVPAMITQLMASPNLSEYDLSSLLALSSGGAPAPPAMASRVRGNLNDVLIGQGYGLTECSAAAVTNGGPDYQIRPESCGLPAPPVDVKVVDPVGTELPPGSVGEVWLNGPGVVIGYWERPEATAEAFADGWLRTGDLGYLDDEGFLYIVDRAKDMIIRGGENVYCAEVEAAIHEHPAVAEVAVTGVPHEVYGEEVGAVVHTLPEQFLDADELRSYLEPRIAAFKIPAHIQITKDDLPRNAAGKLLKKQIKREHGWLGEE